MADYDLRPRSFGAIATDAEKLREAWPDITAAYTPIATVELPSRLWHFGALRRRLGEALQRTPELLLDIASTKEIFEPTPDEKERIQAHALRGEEEAINTITRRVMKRGGRDETGIERARRVFPSIEHVCRVLHVLERINGPEGIPSTVAKRGLLKPSIVEIMKTTERVYRTDVDAMQSGPDDGETARITVTLPGPGSYPIATGVVHVEELKGKAPRHGRGRWGFRVELPGSTALIPFGNDTLEAIGGDVYKIAVAPT